MPATHILILFDGLCEPNPGGLGCFGYVIQGLGSPVDQVVGSGAIQPVEGQQMTNNYAEYAACGKAVAYLLANCRSQVGLETQLVICGDSKLVVEQLMDRWQCNAENLKPLLDSLKEKLLTLGCQWKAEWIPREHNIQADLLSRAAYVGRTGKPVPERSKEAK